MARFNGRSSFWRKAKLSNMQRKVENPWIMLAKECEAIVEEEYLERLDKCVVGTSKRVIEVKVLTNNFTARGVSNISAKFYGKHFSLNLMTTIL